MRRRLRKRLGGGGGEAGFSLVELLVASAMGVILLGAVGSLLVSAVNDQPKISAAASRLSAEPRGYWPGARRSAPRSLCPG